MLPIGAIIGRIEKCFHGEVFGKLCVVCGETVEDEASRSDAALPEGNGVSAAMEKTNRKLVLKGGKMLTINKTVAGDDSLKKLGLIALMSFERRVTPRPRYRCVLQTNLMRTISARS